MFELVTTERSRARALQGMRAGFVSRVVAAAIDVLIVFVVLLAALAAYAVVVYLVTSDPLDFPDPGAVWSGVAFTVLLVVGAHGRVVGLRAHPRRTPSSGCACSPSRGSGRRWRRALLRALIVVYVPVISMLWILVSRKNAGLHDLVCRTAVDLRLAAPARGPISTS